MTLSYTGQRQRILRAKVLDLLGDSCKNCGYSDKSILQIDHVKGKRGRKEKTGSQMYSKILRAKDAQNYQLLCPNCNFIKRHTNSEINYNPNSQFRKAQKRAFDVLGSACVNCGQADVRCLQIDHKLGGGCKERKQLDAAAIAVKARKNPDQYQILCANCNWIKRVKNKEHVHPCDNPTRPSTLTQQGGIRFERQSLKGYISEDKKEALRKLLYGD